MKILFTNHRLHHRGGSELFTAEVAAGLAERGHETAVFTTVGGPVAEALTGAGIPVVSHPAHCPFTPEVIHGQHHLETMTALTAWPETPALYFLHGYGPWEERPPVHPRIRRYAAPCPAFVPWVESIAGIGTTPIQLIRNFYDPSKFPDQRPAGRAFRKALVYHNTMDPSGPVFMAIQDACRGMGWSLEVAGASFSKVLDDPGRILPEYDLVFASGRSALEAMACGCAVIPVTREQTGNWISPGNFGISQDLNFTLRPDEPSTASGLLAVLQSIHPPDLSGLTARVRDTLTLGRTLEHLELAYQNVAASRSLPDAAAENRAMADYLTWISAYVKQSDADRSQLQTWRHEAVLRGTRWKDSGIL